MGRERVDREKLLRRTKAEIVDTAEQLLDENDKEHAKRLQLQGRSMMHLMRGRTYEAEMDAVHRKLADTERRLEMALEELRALKGQNTPLIPIELA